MKRVLTWLCNWPRVRAAWAALSHQNAYIVESAAVVGISVHHKKHATIYRAPVFKVVDSDGCHYFDSKSILAVGIVQDDIYFVPEAGDVEVAKKIVAEKIGARECWEEVVAKPRALCGGHVTIGVGAGDVVVYREEVA